MTIISPRAGGAWEVAKPRAAAPGVHVPGTAYRMDEGLAALASAPPMSGLGVLGLGANDLGRESARALASSLLLELKEVNLGANYLDPVEVKYMLIGAIVVINTALSQWQRRRSESSCRCAAPRGHEKRLRVAPFRCGLFSE